ncbi:hypothetical protein OF83DRAFT_450133 [Amylostereum chailletii]|nr:hypothetical protein OF83DRAFT_450133 [Amylostereum chailletii]
MGVLVMHTARRRGLSGGPRIVFPALVYKRGAGLKPRTAAIWPSIARCLDLETRGTLDRTLLRMRRSRRIANRNNAAEPGTSAADQGVRRRQGRSRSRSPPSRDQARSQRRQRRERSAHASRARAPPPPGPSTRSPFDRVPIDIFVLVLSTVAESIIPEDEAKLKYPCAVAISQVNRAWKDIAERLVPELWTTVPLKRLAWAETALRCSRREEGVMPLTVYADWYLKPMQDWPDVDALLTIRDGHSHRIKRLSLICAPSHDEDIRALLNGWAATSFPSLEVLEYCMADPSDARRLPGKNADTPKLRTFLYQSTFRISNVHASMPSFPSGLVSLTLDFYGVFDELWDLCDELYELHSLEILKLYLDDRLWDGSVAPVQDPYFLTWADGPPDTGHSTPLHNLREFYLEDHIYHAPAVLHHLGFGPKLKVLSLDLIVEQNEDPDVAGWISMARVQDVIHNGVGDLRSELQHLYTTVNPLGQAFCKAAVNCANTFADISLHPETAESLSLRLSVKWASAIDVQDSVTKLLRAVVPPGDSATRVKKITFTVSSYVPRWSFQQQWIDIGAIFPQLRIIVARGPAVPSGLDLHCLRIPAFYELHHPKLKDVYIFDAVPRAPRHWKRERITFGCSRMRASPAPELFFQSMR